MDVGFRVKGFGFKVYCLGSEGLVAGDRKPNSQTPILLKLE